MDGLLVLLALEVLAVPVLVLLLLVAQLRFWTRVVMFDWRPAD